jgi:hypothetical protein
VNKEDVVSADAIINHGTIKNEMAKDEVVTEEMQQIRNMIIRTVSQREALKSEMQEWYERFPGTRFGKLDKLANIDAMLSQLDSNYKRLWDYYNAKRD